jgi:hypothetical protein
VGRPLENVPLGRWRNRRRVKKVAGCEDDRWTLGLCHFSVSECVCVMPCGNSFWFDFPARSSNYVYCWTTGCRPTNTGERYT